jgi:hypothetical protein
MPFPSNAVPITGPLGLGSDQETHPTHLDIFGQGGHRSVLTITERDAISSFRRKFGMLVTVVEDNKTYILCNSTMDSTCNNDVTSNGNWKEFSAGGQLPTFTPFRYVYTDIDGNLTDELYTNRVLLQEFDGATFSDKLINAGFSASGVIVDCTYYTGVQTLNATVEILNPCKFEFSNIIIEFQSNNDLDHMFYIQSPGVSIIGNGRSPKYDQPSTSNTKFVMTNNDQSPVRGGYHIFSADYESFANGQNVCLLQGFDCIGVQSIVGRVNGEPTFTSAAPGGPPGVGGICLLEGNPFVAGGGNTISQIQVRDILVDGTRDHGILIIGAILAQVVNCRVSRAGGHGFYIGGTTSEPGFEGGGTTSTYVLNCYASSGNLAGFCMHSAAYSQLQNCAAEYFGMGYFLRSCQNVSLFGCGAEENQPKTQIPNHLGIYLQNDSGSYLLSDIGPDNVNFFRGSSYWISGGRNIYIPNAYSKDPGGVYDYLTDGAPLAPSNNTSHFTIIGEVRSAYIVNPRMTGTAITPYAIAIRRGGSSPNFTYARDINIFFNPKDDRPSSVANRAIPPNTPILYDPYQVRYTSNATEIPIPAISYTRNTNTNPANPPINTNVNAIVLIEDGNILDTTTPFPHRYKCQVEVKNGSTYYSPLIYDYLDSQNNDVFVETTDPGEFSVLGLNRNTNAIKLLQPTQLTSYIGTEFTKSFDIVQNFRHAVSGDILYIPANSFVKSSPNFSFDYVIYNPNDPVQYTAYLQKVDPYNESQSLLIIGVTICLEDTPLPGNLSAHIRVYDGSNWTMTLINTFTTAYLDGSYSFPVNITVSPTSMWGISFQNSSNTEMRNVYTVVYRLAYV